MRLQRSFKRVLFASHNVISVLLSDQIALNSTSPAIAHALEQRKNQTARKNASAKSKETRAQREKTSAGRKEQLVRADITMKRVEDCIDSGDLTLAAVLSLLNKAIDKLLPTDLVDLPHERLRVLKELLFEVQFDVSGADQISGLLRYLKNKGTEKAKKLLRENARSIPQKVDEL